MNLSRRYFLKKGGIAMVGMASLPSFLERAVAALQAPAQAIDRDGWLHTGDLGNFDDAGRLRIVGRKKDMFIVGGFNAYPAEIEGFLLNHPAVAQAAVIGVPDERLGQVGKAFVVRKDAVGADELIGWCRDRMAGFKVPRSVQFLETLPLNATGRVIKDLLR